MASDIDRCDRRTFIELHQYLNSPQQGLGLSISDSFFGVGKQCGHMAYFEDDGKTHSEDAALIRAGLENGLIDTLHSWGAFDRQPPEPLFIRNTAERLTDELTARGLSVRILSTHGAPINHHNLYARTGPGFYGDDPSSAFYTADLVRRLGIRFYWASELLAWPLSVRKNRRLQKMMRIWQNAVKNGVKRGLGRNDRIRSSDQILNLANPLKLRDGEKLMSFSRYNVHPDGLWGIPTRHTLRYTLNRPGLNRLIREQGYMIVYTHLGMPPRSDEPLFPEADRKALEYLADCRHEGRIWVARTVDLLNYWMVFHHLDWLSETTEDGIRIRITAVDDPVTGKRRPEKGELSGLCFYSPRPRNTHIYLGEERLVSSVFQPDDTGRFSVGLAIPDRMDIGFLDRFSRA